MRTQAVFVKKKLRFHKFPDTCGRGPSNISKKSSQRVGVINRLRNLIPQNAKLQLFKGAILSHFTYIVQSGTSARQVILGKGTYRSIYCDSNSTYPELLKRAKYPTLYNTRLQDIAILIYKVKNGLMSGLHF